MEITFKNINDLIAYENNPRKNDDAVEAVANSIREFGFKVPIIVDKNNVIVAGHTRLKASKKLGFKEVPCIVADDLTEEQIKAFRIADNKTSELAEWDFDKLVSELKELDNIGMTQFGFDDLTELLQKEVVDDNFDEEALIPEVPFSMKGDIYVLGKHRVMCGDSTLADDVKELMNNNLADLIFTDPPYNVDYEGQDGMKIQNDKQSDSDFYNFLLSAFKNMFENIKSGGLYIAVMPIVKDLILGVHLKKQVLKLQNA